MCKCCCELVNSWFIVSIWIFVYSKQSTNFFFSFFFCIFLSLSLSLSLSLPLRLIGDHEEQLEQRKSDEGTHQKYEVLFQRDQEMTQFIENYDETEKKGLQEQKDTQQVIVQLLEAMSKDLGRQNNM